MRTKGWRYFTLNMFVADRSEFFMNHIQGFNHIKWQNWRTSTFCLRGLMNVREVW